MPTSIADRTVEPPRALVRASDGYERSLKVAKEQARYVGRVGGLAVALGIGVALAGFPATAAADTPDSSDSTPSESKSHPATSATGSATHRSSTTTSSTSTDKSPDPPTPRSTSRGVGEVRAKVRASGGVDRRPAATRTGTESGSTTSTDPKNDRIPVKAGARSDSGRRSVDTKATSAGTVGDGSIEIAARAAGDAPADEQVASSTAAAATSVPTASQVADASARRSYPVRTFLTNVLGALGIGPAAGGDPAPAQTPMLMTVLAWVRREIEQTFFNKPPTITYNSSTTTLTTDGTIVGKVVATDPEGDPVQYTVKQQPPSGTVTIDETGEFTYTPADDNLLGYSASFVIAATDTGLHLYGLDSLLHPFTAGTTLATVTVDVPPISQRTDAFTITDRDLATGAITGQVKSLAPVDVPLTYTLGSTGPLYGNVVVDVSTGKFIYTPTEAIRLAAAQPLGFSSGDDVDTFTIVVTEGGATSEVDVSVPVLPDYNEVLSNFPVGNDPVAISVIQGDNDGTKAIWVLNNGDGTLTGYDISTYDLLYSVDVGSEPVTMTQDPNYNLLYVVNAGSKTVSVVSLTGDNLSEDDTNTPTVVDTIQFDDTPADVAVSADSAYLYVTTDGGYVSVIDTATYTEEQTYAVGLDPHGIAIDSYGTLYVANTGDGTASIIYAGGSTTTFAVGSQPYDIALSPDESELYITDQGANAFYVYAGSIDNTANYFLVGDKPNSLAVNDDGTVYMTNSGAKTITLYDPAVLSTTTVLIGDDPVGIFLDEDTGTAYITLSGSNEVQVVSLAPPVLKPDDAKTNKGFDIKNYTSDTAVFLGYYDPATGTISATSDDVRVGPTQGQVFGVGEVIHFSIWGYKSEKTFVYPVFETIPGPQPATYYLFTLKYNPDNNTKYTGCSVESGGGLCSHYDVKKGDSTIAMRDPEKTIVIVDYGGNIDNAAYQSMVINNVCPDGKSSDCKFVADKVLAQLMSDPIPVGNTIVNNTTNNLEIDLGEKFVYSQTSSLTLSVKVGVSVEKYVSTEVTATTGRSTTESAEYSQLIKVFIEPGYTGYVCASAPLERASGSWTVQLANTTFQLNGTIYDYPDESRSAEWSAEQTLTGQPTSCSGGGSTSADGDGGAS
ncbi:YncE family protein [Mycobacterium sp. CVI_P3]|uniref:YncE family protein n=1 Tax=Mycobacterium pinniadriaticum TaxID=2994102 RepID=A0ABT3SQ74_9MYCO|nr:YncE family protein [Mycobacterium pinniadriaticum]MCX2934912.1 YncE family protein [Mycobacterium pinniadriaticum]MCX2941334.1 YncE family protein [Mycobacterium pinniadriaticum]